MLAGCAALQGGFETPSVSLSSVTPLENTGLEQRFAVGLRITNPNSQALNLNGISLALELDGVKVLKGAANDIPSIAAYGNELVTVEVSIGLLEGLAFMRQFMQKNSGELAYRLSANLDTGLPFIGRVPVADSGTINLAGLR